MKNMLIIYWAFYFWASLVKQYEICKLIGFDSDEPIESYLLVLAYGYSHDLIWPVVLIEYICKLITS